MTKHERANLIFYIQECFLAIKNITASDRISELCVTGTTKASMLGEEVKRELEEVKKRKIDPTS